MTLCLKSQITGQMQKGGMMKIEVAVSDPAGYATPALVVGCFEDYRDEKFYAKLDRSLAGALTALYEQKEFAGKLNRVKVLHTLGTLPAERLVLVGLGKRKELDSERLRQAAGSVAQALRSTGVSRCSIILHLQVECVAFPVQAVTEGMLLGSYSFDQYRTSPKEQVDLTEMTILVTGKSQFKEAEKATSESRKICDAARLARDLVSHPCNVATPSYLAEQAMAIAGRYGIQCRVFDRDEIEGLGMNGLISVSKGSIQAPRFIVMEYHGGKKGGKPTVLIGKGVTFDSGGISLKPREGMERMKDDMAGAAAVIGTLQATAALSLPVNLVGLIPAAENMPDGRAYKPGDVVTTMAGKTVEINNTDAEGRMILCEALHYAHRYNPAAVIDLATLTGACIVALGTQASGMMGNHNALKIALKKAGDATGERLWELPLWEEYGESMKSDIADLKNAGGPNAGSITAGWFLMQFVGKMRWVHLDIAGTAWEEKGKHYLPKGATGVGVRLLVDYLRGL